MLEISNNEKKWAVILHLTPLAGYFIPIAGFLVPFTIWLLKKNESAYLDQQGREVLNFIISIICYFAMSVLLCVLLIGFALLSVIPLLAFVVTIVAAVQTSDGKNFRYPLIFRLV